MTNTPNLQQTCNKLATDCISRQEVIDTVHKIIYGFFSGADGVMTDTDKTLLSVNKAICNGVRALTSAQPYTDKEIQAMQDLEQAQLDKAYELGWKEGREALRQAAIDICNNAIDLWHGQLGEGIVIAVKKKIKALPSAQPEDCDTCKHGYFGDSHCDNCRVRYPSHYERRTDDR